MLNELKECKTIYDLGALLNIPAKHLTYLLYVLPENHRYTQKCLSKKNGTKRHIYVPNKRLKILQKRLSYVLYECRSELNNNFGDRRSFGFERDRTIFDNAQQHLHKRWVLNLDLKDFFPSINFGRVIGYFKSNRNFSLEPRIATLVAQIACYKNELPQGAPSSPVISNLIAESLDFRLSLLAKKARCDYSRYADDITFSTNEKSFPSLLAEEDSSNQGWTLSDQLIERIEDAGFKVNLPKTRLAYRDSRQMVTGLVVNQKPSIPRDQYKNCRAAVHSIMRAKPWQLPRFHSSYKWNCEDAPPTVDQLSSLQGKLAFLHDIAFRGDTRPEKTKYFSPSARTRTYQSFLLYRYFVNGSEPILLTEGISDILYIKAALKGAKADVPHLVTHNPIGPNEIHTSFYNFPEKIGSLIGLTGGTGSMGLFLERYRSFLAKLSSNVPKRPFVILVDNDKGLEGIQGTLKKYYGIDLQRKDNSNFLKIASSTYIVKTPHIGNKQKTACEDFLDPNALSQNLSGKTFSNHSKYDESLYFGKFILGSHILKNYEKYSFTKFQPVVDRISAAIADANK